MKSPYTVVVIVQYSYDGGETNFEMRLTGTVWGKDVFEAMAQARGVFEEITDVGYNNILSVSLEKIGE